MPRRGRKRSPEVSVAAFSDIAFLLIIFFILVTSMTKNLGFTSEIPAGEKSEAEEEKTNIVAIRDDRLFFNDKRLDARQLEAALRKLELAEKESEQQKTVMLEATGSVSWQKYFAAMAAISDAGGVVAIVRED